jgi:hypothetical protein
MDHKMKWWLPIVAIVLLVLGNALVEAVAQLIEAVAV